MSIADIRKALDVTPEMARRYWLGVSKPREEKLRRLADLIRTTPHELEYGATMLSERDDGRYTYVRRYEAIGGLGRGRINGEHVEISGTHAYRTDWIYERGWTAEDLAVISAEGDSMSPTINDGDVVLVNMADTKIVSGQVYAIEDADQGTRIKRLFRQLDGRVRVVSDNPDKRLHPDDFLTPDTSGARIIGKVVHRSGSV